MSRTFKTVDYDQTLDLRGRLGDCLPPRPTIWPASWWTAWFCLTSRPCRPTQAWAATLRRMCHIGDFTNWQDDAINLQRFTELLRHLKVKTT